MTVQTADSITACEVRTKPRALAIASCDVHAEPCTATQHEEQRLRSSAQGNDEARSEHALGHGICVADVDCCGPVKGPESQGNHQSNKRTVVAGLARARAAHNAEGRRVSVAACRQPTRTASKLERELRAERMAASQVMCWACLPGTEFGAG